MSDLQNRLELVLGGHCPAPPVREGRSTLEVPVSPAQLERLVKHWGELSFAARPRLRGFSLSRPETGGQFLNVLLDAGGRDPVLAVVCEWPAGKALPRLSAIWPHAAWWEGEMQRFEGVGVEGYAERGDTRWLPS